MQNLKENVEYNLNHDKEMYELGFYDNSFGMSATVAIHEHILVGKFVVFVALAILHP